MKIISWNVNGLRSVYRKNFLKWFGKEKADIVCLQEIKAHVKQLPSSLINVENYFSYFNSAKKKGYSGVAVYTKEKPLKVEKKIGISRFDREGRVLKLEFSDFVLFNLYLPQGGREKQNLDYKLETYDYLFNYLKKIKKKNIILTGDFNIAHEEIDLARPKDNKDNTMFTPKERKKIDRIIELGFVDSFRKLHKKGGVYSWWLYAFKARKRNLGWRLDYVFVSKKLGPKIQRSFILNKVKGSDHCPVGIEIS